MVDRKYAIWRRSKNKTKVVKTIFLERREIWFLCICEIVER